MSAVWGPPVARRRRPSPLRRHNGAGLDPGLEADWKINTVPSTIELLCWDGRYSQGLVECLVGFNGLRLDNPSLSLSSRSRYLSLCHQWSHHSSASLHLSLRRPPAELCRYVSTIYYLLSTIYTVLRNFRQKVHFRKCGGPINSIHLRLSSL